MYTVMCICVYVYTQSYEYVYTSALEEYMVLQFLTSGGTAEASA